MIIIDDPHFSHSYWYPDFALASPASRPPRWAKACRCPGGNTTPSARRNGPASEAPSWEPGAMRCCSHFVKFWHFLTSCVFWTFLYMFWLFSNVEVVSNWLRSWLTMSECTSDVMYQWCLEICRRLSIDPSGSSSQRDGHCTRASSNHIIVWLILLNQPRMVQPWKNHPSSKFFGDGKPWTTETTDYQQSILYSNSFDHINSEHTQCIYSASSLWQFIFV